MSKLSLSSAVENITANFPYLVGTEILLRTRESEVIKVRVVRILATTTSCVVLVQPDSSLDLRVLKLYDRRCSKLLRYYEGAKTWSSELEDHYQEFLNTNKHVALFNRWITNTREDAWSNGWKDADVEDDYEEWGVGIREAFVQFQCQMMYQAETRAYNRMRNIQGIIVPKLFAEVTVCQPENSTAESDPGSAYLNCPGLLLQYIEGPELSDIAKHIPKNLWQPVIDNAIQIIHTIGDLGICNEDVNVRCFIMAKGDGQTSDVDDPTPRLFLVDFGLCSFKKEDGENDGYSDFRAGLGYPEFQICQAKHKEEFSIGVILETQLKGNYKFNMSERILHLIEEYGEGEDGVKCFLKPSPSALE